jgi:hypothetical protein
LLGMDMDELKGSCSPSFAKLIRYSDWEAFSGDGCGIDWGCWEFNASLKASQAVPWNKLVILRSKLVADAEPPGHWGSSRPLRFRGDCVLVMKVNEPRALFQTSGDK